MAAGIGRYRGWTLLVKDPYEDSVVFFVIGPGYDPKVMFGFRPDYHSAVEAGSKVLLREARDEQNSGSGR